jgi:hypothetical protein
MKMEDFWELVGCVLFMALVVFLMVVFCLLTPDQLSGEGDLHQEELRQFEAQEKEGVWMN